MPQGIVNFAQYNFQTLQIPYITASYISFGKREIENLLHQPLKYGKISGIALNKVFVLQAYILCILFSKANKNI